MELFRHLFLVMSLSGSAVTALYGAAYPIARRWFPRRWRSRLLRVALFFYLVPLPLLRDSAVSWLYWHTPIQPPTPWQGDFWTPDPSYIINRDGGQLFVGSRVMLEAALLLCAAAVLAVLIAKQLRRYLAVYRAYLAEPGSRALPPWVEEEFRALKAQLGIRGRVGLIRSRCCGAPLTMGVFAPVVILPAGPEPEPESCRYILKHELLHIKNRDLPVRLLGLLAVALHWYNPLCHLFYRELCLVSELECDRGVLQDSTDRQRQRYGHLLLDLASGQRAGEPFAVGITGSSRRAFARRLREMKQPGGPVRPVPAILAALVLAAALVLGTVPALAYQPPQRTAIAGLGRDSEMVFQVLADLPEPEPLPCQHFFTDAAGGIIPLKGDETLLNGCSHRFAAGKTTHHTSTGGGCVTVVNHARRCQNCGGVREETEYLRITLTECNHHIKEG